MLHHPQALQFGTFLLFYAHTKFLGGRSIIIKRWLLFQLRKPRSPPHLFLYLFRIDILNFLIDIIYNIKLSPILSKRLPSIIQYLIHHQLLLLFLFIQLLLLDLEIVHQTFSPVQLHICFWLLIWWNHLEIQRFFNVHLRKLILIHIVLIHVLCS